MRLEPLYSVTLVLRPQAIGATPDGTRMDVEFEGDLDPGGRLAGHLKGVDYLTLRQDGVAHPHIHGVTTSPEGDVAAFHATGLGDAKARDVLREHERIVRDALKSHGGSEVKTMGDGFMASFSAATKALECAIAIQQAFARHNESTQEPINVRIGLNAGEPIAEDDPGGRGDLFGTAVNMAARIGAKADGGEILASNVVREWRGRTSCSVIAVTRSCGVSRMLCVCSRCPGASRADGATDAFLY